MELEEYEQMLAAPESADLTEQQNQETRAATELMRWTGMRISDAHKFADPEIVDEVRQLRVLAPSCFELSRASGLVGERNLASNWFDAQIVQFVPPNSAFETTSIVPKLGRVLEVRVLANA